MEIFKLYGSIMMNTSDAENSIAKTSEKAETMGSKLASGVKTAAKWGAAITTAAVAVGGAMVKATQETAAQMDTIDKASQRMKIDAESYQELAYAAELSGVEMSILEKAAKKLEGTDMNMDDAIEQIMSLGTAEERASAAAELFGDSVAYQMTPLLNAGAEGMEAMKDEAHSLGLVMSNDSVSAGAKMNDTFTKVKESLGSLKNKLMSDMMPYVQKILDWVVENLPTIMETVKSVMDAILPIVEPILETVMELLPPIMKGIKDFLDWIMPYLRPVINGVMAFINGILSLFKGDFDGFLEGIKSLLTGLGSALWGIGGDIINSLWDGIKNVWSSVKEWFDDKVQWVKDKFSWITGKQNATSTSTQKVSHASGLAYVPYDNYGANLHRGEAVLTAQEAKAYREGNTNNSTVVNLTVNGAQGQDVRELANIIMEEIQNATDRKVAVFA